jgi:hypothetical protein
MQNLFPLDPGPNNNALGALFRTPDGNLFQAEQLCSDAMPDAEGLENLNRRALETFGPAPGREMGFLLENPHTQIASPKPIGEC